MDIVWYVSICLHESWHLITVWKNMFGILIQFGRSNFVIFGILRYYGTSWKIKNLILWDLEALWYILESSPPLNGPTPIEKHHSSCWKCESFNNTRQHQQLDWRIVLLICGTIVMNHLSPDYDWLLVARLLLVICGTISALWHSCYWRFVAGLLLAICGVVVTGLQSMTSNPNSFISQ